MSSNILVVEDNADNMTLLAWTLEDEGFAFEGVGSAEAAIEALEQRPFDLVLMDISLPGMDGKEATRRIRADRRLACLPVIAITAHAISGEDDAIMASGVDALLTKPIDEELLLRTIRSALKVAEVTHGQSACG
jgi:CheY-like chemotaxis protein